MEPPVLAQGSLRKQPEREDTPRPPPKKKTYALQTQQKVSCLFVCRRKTPCLPAADKEACSEAQCSFINSANCVFFQLKLSDRKENCSPVQQCFAFI